MATLVPGGVVRAVARVAVVALAVLVLVVVARAVVVLVVVVRAVVVLVAVRAVAATAPERAGREATLGVAPAGVVVPAGVMVPAGIAMPAVVAVLAAVGVAASTPTGPGPAEGRTARVASAARMAASEAQAPVAEDTARAAPAPAPADTARAGIAAEHRTAGTLTARARAQGPAPPPVGRVGTVTAPLVATPAGGSGGTPAAARDATASTAPRAASASSANRDGTVASATRDGGANSAGKDGSAEATAANEDHLADPGQDLFALPAPRRAGRPAPMDVTIATGVPATGVSAPIAAPHPDTEAGRAMTDLARPAARESGTTGDPNGTRAIAAATTSVTGTAGLSGARLGTGRSGPGVLARSATTSRGAGGRLAPSGLCANAATAGTYPNASLAPSLTSARNGVAAPTVAPARNGAKAGRGNLADRGDRVASLVLARARGRRPLAPGPTSPDLTGAARRPLRRLGRGFRTASPKTSCPAR